jgi:hypothetical protein
MKEKFGIVFPSKHKNVSLFTLYLVIILTIHCLSDRFLLTDNYYKNLYIEQFGEEKTKELYKIRESNIFQSSMIVFVSYLAEIACISLIIYTGSMFFNLKIAAGTAISIVLKSYFIFVIQYFIEFIYMLYQGVYIPFFTSLSLGRFFENVPFYFAYPLHLINIWELLFTMLFMFNYKKTTGVTLNRAFINVFIPYSATMICWILFVVYMNLLNV